MEEFIDFNEELSNPGFVFPVVEADTFVERLLPPLKAGLDATRVKSILKKKGRIDSRGRWRGLWRVSEGKKRRKYDTFAVLLDIFEKATSVASAEVPHLEQVLGMMLISERFNNRSWRKKSSQTACFSLKRKGRQAGPPYEKAGTWSDIALTACFKKTDNDVSRRKNVRKIISNIQLAMVRDPSRRFSFGITVENTMMRLWFCSRASPVVSTPFDFSEDLDTVLRAFLSLAFATREELGWDPTVCPFIRGDGTCVYRIDVDGETYETRETISSSSADQLLGHATRVWKVRRLSSDEPETEADDEWFVLKDVWIEDDWEPEHSLQEKLLSDVEEKYGAEIRRCVASHLLTPIGHCFVRVDGEEDHTTEVMMRGCSPSYREKYRVNVEHLGCNDYYDEDENGTGPTTEIGLEGLGRDGLRDPLHWYNPTRRILRRRHYRVVFKEVASPLHSLRNFEDVFSVLSDSAKVLKWIHGAGWVHRDISTGNLYYYRGRGLIGDFEYAKRKNSNVEDEEVVGTRDFMAIEATSRSYLHLPRKDDSIMEARLKALEEGRMEELARLQALGRPPRFFYNDLHDLESLWWIAIWKVLNTNRNIVMNTTDIDAKERIKERELAKGLLFPRSGGTLDRRLFLRTNTHYWDCLAWMQFDALKGLLDDVRKALVDKYSKFEANFPNIQMHLFDGIHPHLRDLFRRCRDCVREAKSRKNLVPGPNCQPTRPECCGSKTLTQKQPQQLAPYQPAGHGKRRRTCYHPFPGAECENCVPRQGKRKRDVTDVGAPIRPARVARVTTVAI